MYSYVGVAVPSTPSVYSLTTSPFTLYVTVYLFSTGGSTVPPTVIDVAITSRDVISSKFVSQRIVSPYVRLYVPVVAGAVTLRVTTAVPFVYVAPASL